MIYNLHESTVFCVEDDYLLSSIFTYLFVSIMKFFVWPIGLR